MCVINVGFIYMVKASRLNAMKASKSKALAAIASGLGELRSYCRASASISQTYSRPATIRILTFPQYTLNKQTAADTQVCQIFAYKT